MTPNSHALCKRQDATVKELRKGSEICLMFDEDILQGKIFITDGKKHRRITLQFFQSLTQRNLLVKKSSQMICSVRVTKYKLHPKV